MNRYLVVLNAVLATTMLVLALLLDPQVPFAILVALGLAMIAVLAGLEIRTRSIANAANCRIDERERSRRDHAHRLAYWLLSLPVGLMVGFGVARIQRALESGGDLIIANPQLTVFGVLLWIGVFLWISLPTAIIAWTEPEPLDDEDLP